MLSGRILLTGCGYLARAILRQAQSEGWSASFTLYSRGEYNQFLCRKKFPNARYVLGDIRDEERLTLALAGHDLCIHTAAVKSVPGAEANVSECCSVNIGGTLAVISAARKAKVEKVVSISTDKSCLPETAYGFTKALLERLMGEAAVQGVGDTQYVTVRYGNVVGSSGSVVPLFKQQFEQSGVVTITDPAMTRFWMPANEAVDLIVYAALHGESGHIYIPSPMALSLDALVSYVLPEANRQIIGLRPGEKMHEKLLTYEESKWLQPESLNYYDLPTPLLRKYETNARPFEISSETAERMRPEDFINAANESEQI